MSTDQPPCLSGLAAGKKLPVRVRRHPAHPESGGHSASFLSLTGGASPSTRAAGAAHRAQHVLRSWWASSAGGHLRTGIFRHFASIVRVGGEYGRVGMAPAQCQPCRATAATLAGHAKPAPGSSPTDFPHRRRAGLSIAAAITVGVALNDTRCRCPWPHGRRVALLTIGLLL